MSCHVIYMKDGAKMMRPVLTAAEYRNLRNNTLQKTIVASVRKGRDEMKTGLVQMNYSCLPNDDGSLKGSKRMSTTVGMDIDHLPESQMKMVKECILAKKDELGLLMLELSARGRGYHLVFKRRPEMTQEENLKWASDLLGVEFDKGAKDITRVFFTTTASPEDLIFLSDELFEIVESEECSVERQLNQSKVESSPNSKLSTVNSKLSADSKLSTVNSKLNFRGIPYSSIITKYWEETGGVPVEGERNVRLYQLASNLRSICDNRRDLLMQVMPRLGLDEGELRSIVDSACKEPPKGVSKIMQNILEMSNVKCKTGDGEEGESKADSKLYTLNSKLRETLPIGLRESLVGVPESMHMPVLCAVMPIAATYADQVEVQYCDGEMQKLGLMSIIHGEQASGKSVCKRVVNIWKRQFDREDKLAREREEAWTDHKKARKANEKLPDNPKVLIRVVPVTISCSTLLKRLKYAQGHTLFSFCEELDTLRKTNSAGNWSAKYDIYRLAFDSLDSEWGQDYNSDQAESGVVKVAYNWTMLGTGGAVRKCFKGDNIENGLSSRILLAEMPDSSFAKMPKFGRRTAEDEERIQKAVTRLRSCSGTIDVPRLRETVEQWCEEKRVEALKDIDRVKDTYRKRAAVIGFRCGVIFHLLSGDATESDACLDFALMMAEYCLGQQIKTFGEALANAYVEARDTCQRLGVNHSVFDQLPPTFTMDDLRALKRGQCGESALRTIITRWRGDGWVEKTDAKHWSKKKAS